MKTEPPTTILKIETPSTEFTIEAPSTEENKIYESQTVFNTINNCFHTCKSCFDEGDELNNNCIECKDGYIFLNELVNKTNCYNECRYF